MERPTPLVLVRAVLVVAAAVLGGSVLPRPGGATVDLVLLIVVAGALIRGAMTGALLGLAAGWVVDLVPPGGHPLGAAALSYAAAGALAGVARRFGAWSVLLPVLTTAVAAVVIQGSRSLVAAASGAPPHWSGAGWSVLLTVAVGIVIVPLLLVLERALVRRRLG